jgi:ectoine hydroxylase-related dioxygenase (phytanoyl-CoA dioxygenase family)
MQATDSPRAISDADEAFFRQSGFVVVRGLLPEGDVERLRRRADAIAAQIDEHVQRDRQTRQARLQRSLDAPGTADQSGAGGGMMAGMATAAMETAAMGATTKRPDPAQFPEVHLSDQHARRGDFFYPVRRRPVDQAALQAALASDDPFNRVEYTVEHLGDHDEVFRSVAAHPNIVAVLRTLIGPNVKLWYDHLFSKPPFNDRGPFRGANRYHQDGFWQFSKPPATCWLALDEVTVENGCLRYIPRTTGYGEFSEFDLLGDRLTVQQLEQEVLLELQPGDAAFHDRWAIHATGPNETARRRRGLALHYANAESQWGDFANDRTGFAHSYVQTRDGLHLRDGVIQGNVDYRLVCGREFDGCI